MNQNNEKKEKEEKGINLMMTAKMVKLSAEDLGWWGNGEQT